VAKPQAHEDPLRLRNDDFDVIKSPQGSRPGLLDTDAYTKDGWSVPLPRERKFGTGLKAAPDFPPQKALTSWVWPTPKASYERFVAHPLRAHALDVLGTYVGRVIPSPVHAQGLWVLTAFSYPNNLFCINVGETEVLSADEEPPGVTRISVSAEQPDFEEQFTGLRDELGVILDSGLRYNIKRDVAARRITCPDLHTARKVLDQEFVIDGVYRLNCALIRREGSQTRRHHNLAFAAAVLTRAWEAHASGKTVWAAVDLPPRLDR